MSITDQLREDVKEAMRAREKARVGALRMALAAIKQREVDERTTLDDEAVAGVLRKMLKQRQDSIEQFAAGGRDDLVRQERFEIEVLEQYLPQPLSSEKIDEIIAEVIRDTGASGPRDMGKVMSEIKTRVEGRADMGEVSTRVKQRLSPA